MNTKKVFSGIQPSGSAHIGNYLGAIKNWADNQDEKENIFCVVDLHSITVPQAPKELAQNIQETAKIIIASGIDPENATIFIQSDRPEHSELAWILNCNTQMGELSRMTQYKEKGKFSDLDKYLNDYINYLEKDLQEHKKITTNYGRLRTSSDIMIKKAELVLKNKKISATEQHELLTRLLKLVKGGSETLEAMSEHLTATAETAMELNQSYLDYQRKVHESPAVGLFDYPVLMAADILLYDTDEVPVGDDQKQHVELARVIAKRMNSKYGKDTVCVPEPIIKKEGARIMALDDPKKKMAKSANSENSYIALRDDAETIRRKIKKAVTDSGSEIVFTKGKPALANLLTIYSSFSGEKITDIVNNYKGKGYADFKQDLAEVIIQGLAPIQTRLEDLDNDPEFVAKVLAEGSEKAAPIARATLSRVKERIGLG